MFRCLRSQPRCPPSRLRDSVISADQSEEKGAEPTNRRREEDGIKH